MEGKKFKKKTGVEAQESERTDNQEMEGRENQGEPRQKIKSSRAGNRRGRYSGYERKALWIAYKQRSICMHCDTPLTMELKWCIRILFNICAMILH